MLVLCVELIDFVMALIPTRSSPPSFVKLFGLLFLSFLLVRTVRTYVPLRGNACWSVWSVVLLVW